MTYDEDMFPSRSPVIVDDEPPKPVLEPAPMNLDEAIAAEQAHQQTLEPPEVIEKPDTRARNVTPPPHPLAIVWPSRSGGKGHVVGIIDYPEGRAVACNCEAMLSITKRPKGCWAMQATRELLGIPPVKPPENPDAD